QNLLRRASQEERQDMHEVHEEAPVTVAPEPSHRAAAREAKGAEGLGTLSVDIAMADNTKVIDEVWQRRLAGETGVYTRDLYSGKGQQTFDEISRRYRADESFRAAVDRYCGDFEKLLKGIEGNDADHSMARTYLTSD